MHLGHLHVLIAIGLNHALIGSSFVFSQPYQHYGKNFQRTKTPTSKPKTTFAAIASSTSTQMGYEQESNTPENSEFTTIFDFSNPKAVDCFERIDDAIMGGISTSSIRHVVPTGSASDGSSSYATWSGICRVEGGGFCGTRTLPLNEPIRVEANNSSNNSQNTKGFFLDCRLTSDNEPARRVWKMSTRTDQSRGEQLYQAEFQIPERTVDKEVLTDEWVRILIPFSDFRLVRGARFVPDGEVMNVSATGVHQIGLTLSKFRSAQNMTVMENFRPGYFEVHIRKIGVYSIPADVQGQDEKQVDVSSMSVDPPRTLSKAEIEQNRPIPVKILFSLSKLFFSEQANRRRSAMKILRQERGLSRLQAILYGIGIRRSSSGLILATMQVGAIIATDAFRSFFGLFLRYGLFVPLRVVAKVKKIINAALMKLVSGSHSESPNSIVSSN